MARRDKALADVLDQFVCVRLVQALDLDLSLFSFDFEQTWAAFFLHPDRTIYGRYGTRTERERDEDVTLQGFRQAAEAALQLHRTKEKQKHSLAKKTAPPPLWKTPREFPLFPAPLVRADGSRKNCVHCHHLAQAELFSRRAKGLEIRDRDYWRYPMPDVLGLTLDRHQRAKVLQVQKHSPADKAGFQVGDELITLQEQPLISLADVQWVLHHAPDRGSLSALIERAGKRLSLSLQLAEGWRRAGNVSWRDVIWAIRFQIAGFKSTTAPAAVRQKNGLPEDSPALLVEALPPAWLRTRNDGAEKAGLRAKDLVVAVDGQTKCLSSETDFHFHLLRKKPGEKVTLSIRRQGSKQELTYLIR